MILAFLLACAKPVPHPGPKVVVVVADTLRADLGGAPEPAWWAGGRRYTHAYSGATQTVASLPVLASGRAATEEEIGASLPGSWCGRPYSPGRGLPNYPDDAWPDRVVTDHLPLALAGAVQRDDVLPFYGPGSRDFASAAVDAIHAGRADALLLWSGGAHSPYDGVLVDRQGRRLTTTTTHDAMEAGCTEPTAEQAGYLRLSYAAGAERALASLEIVVIEAIQAGAVVILTADHGEALGEGGRWGHGRSLDDEQVRVPLVVWGPGIEPAVDDRPVPATCVGQTARAVLGLPSTCDLRVGELPPEPPVVGMMLADGTWDERVILAPVAVTP